MGFKSWMERGVSAATQRCSCFRSQGSILSLQYCSQSPLAVVRGV
jgi:hypothetical protein